MPDKEAYSKKEEKELKKAFTFENFKKLLYFMNVCAGEGLQEGTICADEYLYFNILKDVSDDVFDYTKFDKLSYEFIETGEVK